MAAHRVVPLPWGSSFIAVGPLMTYAERLPDICRHYW